MAILSAVALRTIREESEMFFILKGSNIVIVEIVHGSPSALSAKGPLAPRRSDVAWFTVQGSF